jgi:hypothetical protein
VVLFDFFGCKSPANRFALASSAGVRPLIRAGHVRDASALKAFIEKSFELVMHRHIVALAAFLVEAQPPAFAGRVMVLDPHRHDPTGAGEGVGLA